MNLRSIAANQTELDLGSVVVFFSYATPVAAHVKGSGYIRTEKKWSMTTSRHINKWLAGVNAREVPQSELDSLIAARGEG